VYLIYLFVLPVKGRHRCPRGLRPLPYWVCWCESRRRHECLSLVNVVFYHVKVSVSGWSLVQRSPTECGVPECDREAGTLRKHWSARGFVHGGVGWGRGEYLYSANCEACAVYSPLSPYICFYPSAPCQVNVLTSNVRLIYHFIFRIRYTFRYDSRKSNFLSQIFSLTLWTGMRLD
jgi:hypothetical protein